VISNTTCYLHFIFTIIVSSLLFICFVCVLRFLPCLLVNCIHFFNFIDLFREFYKYFVVFFDEHFFIYGPVIFFSYCGCLCYLVPGEEPKSHIGCRLSWRYSKSGGFTFCLCRESNSDSLVFPFAGE